jgi:PAS domain S-box-containing protein
MSARMTERKRATGETAAAAPESETRMDELLRSAPELIAILDQVPSLVTVVDPRGRVLYLNGAARRLIGWDAEAPLGRLALTDLHPQWVNDRLLHEGVPSATRDGVWSGQTALLDAEGCEVPAAQTLVAHKSSCGRVELISSICTDESERERSEAALRESDEIFRQIGENINEALWIFDLDQGRPVYVSPAYERIWGRPVEGVYADPSGFLAGVAPEDRQRLSSPINAKNGRGRDEEFRIDRPDGSSRWLRGRSFPIHDARGSVTRIVGLTEDVTERKRMESELRQAQRLEGIGHLAAGVAHEINTPVQYVGDNMRFLQESFDVMAGLIERYRSLLVALEDGPQPELVEAVRCEAEEGDLVYVLEEIPRAVAQSYEGVERVAEIVRAMKEFSHPGGSERTPVEINRVIQSTLTVARNEWKYVAELVTDFDPWLPAVPCYPAELNQALLNIVINAAHAIADAAGEGRERGTLTIRTRGREDGVEIEVRDTGTGIPEEARPRIFDLFFTTKEVGRGTGQGLTLAHSAIVDRHGGSLRFETEEGKGTSFFIWLPLRDVRTEAEVAA